MKRTKYPLIHVRIFNKTEENKNHGVLFFYHSFYSLFSLLFDYL